MLCLLVLFLWSFTAIWRFPDALPAAYTLRFWVKGLAQAADPLLITFIVGALSTCVGIVLVTGCLEYEVRLQQQGKHPDSQKTMWLVYLPLLVPQISFLFGIQTFAVLLHIEGSWLSMVGIHLVFVLPYIFLTLSSVYRRFDRRYVEVAVALNGSAFRSFLQIKLPMLAKPMTFAMATGFAVSVAQYLPTMYLGAGRFMTITTETVSLASGSDRRLVAVYALCQFLLPMLVYTIAIYVPTWFFRNRKAMQN
jgi:putative thiamine transport system permease protein